MNTKDLMKRYNKILLAHFTAEQSRQDFLNNIYKMCPNCGVMLNISAKGCDNCLQQFGGNVDEDRCKTKYRRIYVSD